MMMDDLFDTDVLSQDDGMKDTEMNLDQQRNNTNCRVIYIHSHKLMSLSDRMGKVKKRASVVHALMNSYGLISKMRCIEPKDATVEELSAFHTTKYINCLKELSESDDPEKYDDTAEAFGLGYDCPADNVYPYASIICGASLTAAECLNKGICKVAINWTGGWHHARKDEASGFCYFNDIVLAILKLKENYDRILYVDLDLHHGDGVEDAFCATPKVFTVSIHKYSPGFFPGSGDVNDVGFGKGKFHCVNIPLHDGATDETFTTLFQRIICAIKEKFHPDAVVCQCGADGLVGDPMNSFNLTPLSLGACVKTLMQWEKPLLLLGGGGYNLANTSRCWTYITGLTIEQELPTDIPEHEYFTLYGPDYELSISPGNRPNENFKDYIQQLEKTILGNLQSVR